MSLLDDEGAQPFAGGTALMLMMKAGVLRPKRLVSLAGSAWSASKRNGLRIGAMTTLRALERSPKCGRLAGHCARAETLSNVRVRNVATVGGALAHADPHMDLPPLLAALGARVFLEERKAGDPGRRPVRRYLETTLSAAS